MTLCYGPQQKDVAAAVADLLQAWEDDGKCNDLASDPSGIWRHLNDTLGLAGIPVPDCAGGAGGSWHDVAAAVEELGRRPLLGEVGTALAGASLVAEAAESDDDLADVVEGETIVALTSLYSDRLWQVSGDHVEPTSTVVEPRWFADPVNDPITLCAPDLSSVRLLVPVKAGEGLDLWLTERLRGSDFAATGNRSVDLTAEVAILDNRAFRATRLVVGATPAIDRARAIALALAAVEATGSSEAALRGTIDYLKIREQFGKPVGSFQGLKFMAADAYREIEPLRSVAYAAVEALDGGNPGLALEISVIAKIVADEVHSKTALEAVQMHGGIGFTWELGVHRHYKRALHNRSVAGEDAMRREWLADRIVGLRAVSLATEEIDDELRDLRVEAREWIAANRDDAPEAVFAHEPMSYTTDEREDAWMDRLREGRWLCLSWPTEYGGRGLGPLECIAVNEEFARAGVTRPKVGMAESLLAPAILALGTDAQKARLLPRILSGDDIYCQGFSEPDHGSDLANIATRGVVDGDRIIVNGTKIWQSGAHRANRVFLLCRTDPEASSHRGLTYCLADIADNGVEVRPIRMLTGDNGFNQLYFDGTVARMEDVIGGVNQGWQAAMTTLGVERAGDITTQYLGYRRELENLHRTLAHEGRLVEHALALVPLWCEVVKMKCNGRRVVDLLRVGESVDGLLSIDKVNWSEYHVRFGNVAAQLRGRRGVIRPATSERPEEADYPLDPLQRVMLESLGRRIARGTNQIQRRIIAERQLGMPR